MKTLGLPRGHRVRRSAEFARARTSGPGIHTSHFILVVATRSETTSDHSTWRLGLVVSRRVGNAVQRNRIKRLVRECFRSWPTPLSGPIDLIVIAKIGADVLQLQDVQVEWRRAWTAVIRRASQFQG